jgi:DUF1680 family protein
MDQKTNYPWEGNVSIIINPAKKTKLTISLRIPGWANNKPIHSNLYSYLNSVSENIVIKVNGKHVQYQSENGYAKINRVWKKGDIIEYSIPMEIHRVLANKNVKADDMKIALERGPIVYCLEGVDNPNSYDRFILPDDSKLTFSTDDHSLIGSQKITGEGILFEVSSDSLNVHSKKQDFVAIPYYQWCNRGKTTMNVWIPRKVDKFSISEY